MKRKCHMEIPLYVFHEMGLRFKELKPLFLKFANSHIDPREVEKVVNKVDHDLATGALKSHPDPFKTEGAVKTELNKVFRATGDKKLGEIEEVYKRCCANYKETFLKMVQDRYKEEIENDELDSSWRDLTSIYPDQFDGDNITFGNCHSCKFTDIQSSDDQPVWVLGHVCQSIHALIWRISGLYKEFCREPDVLVSEQSKICMVEELIRLSHYVLDSSTIVHLVKTSNHFHNNL